MLLNVCIYVSHRPIYVPYGGEFNKYDGFRKRAHSGGGVTHTAKSNDMKE